jgi:uncharacterized protein (TIGR01244 family)
MSNSHQTSHTGSDGSAEGPQSGTSSSAMPSSDESSAYKFLELPFFAALDSSLAVAGQLSPGDMAAIREAGFSSVINNRPDGEGGPSQPSHSEIKAAADAVGLHYVYQPVISSQMTMDDVHRFHEHLEALPKPVLAFCRTGTRCTRLFQAR